MGAESNSDPIAGTGCSKWWWLVVPFTLAADYLCQWGLFFGRFVGISSKTAEPESSGFIQPTDSSKTGSGNATAVVAGIAAVAGCLFGGWKLWQHHENKSGSSDSNVSSKGGRPKSMSSCKAVKHQTKAQPPAPVQ